MQMKKTLAFLLALISVVLLSAQDSLNVNDFSIKKTKKKATLLYKNSPIKEFDNPDWMIYRIYNNSLLVGLAVWGESTKFLLLDAKGNSKYGPPFQNADFLNRVNLPGINSVSVFPDYAVLVDSNYNEIPGLKFSKIIRSTYNNEADLSIVWRKYGKKGPLYLYEIQDKQPDGTIKKGLLDLATGTVIAKPIFHDINMWHLLERGVYGGILEPNGKIALYDFGTNRMSDFYDGINGDVKTCRVVRNGLVGLISYSGKELIAPTYKDMTSFSDGAHFVCKEETNQKVGIVDSLGTILMPFDFSTLNYQITNYPLPQYVPVSNGRMYGYYDIKEKKMAKDFEYDIAGPVSSNTASVRQMDGASVVISFNPSKNGARATTEKYEQQLNDLAKFVGEIGKDLQDRYVYAVKNHQYREDALKYFYPYYSNFCTKSYIEIMTRIDTIKKQYGHLFTVEDAAALEDIYQTIKKTKQRLNEQVEKSGGKVIYIGGI